MLNDEDEKLLRDMEREDRAALLKPDPVERPSRIAIVYSGKPGAYTYGTEAFPVGKPFEMPAFHAAALVRANPEDFSFADMNQALELLTELSRDRIAAEEEAKRAATPAPRLIDPAEVAARNNELEAKKAAVDRALKGG